MSLNIVFAMNFPEALLDKLRAVSPEVTVRRPRPEGEDYADADVLYCLRMPDNIVSAPRLKWIQLHAAGVNGVIDHPVFRGDMVVTNASGIHATAVAEFAITALLAQAHRIPRIVAAQGRAAWPSEQERRGPLMPIPVRGATLAVLGYGSIGREVGRLAKAFGMRLVAVKRDLAQKADDGYRRPGVGDPDGSLPDAWEPLSNLKAVLADADFVVNALPLTKETTGIVGAAELAGMKPHAIIVNIGRGATFDEAALIEALNSGRIAAAALDVFAQEPLPSESPLWGVDNLLLSPHISGFMPGHNELVTDLFSENIRRYLANEPLLNRVRPELGY